ncbi:MAG: 23S rRNA (adenine(2503)-C(2))-methyltransferase RlmN [Alphaproteobacteria bacterium]
MTETKKNLIGLSKDELAQEIKDFGEKSFRAKQLWQWIYNQGATSFDQMTNIAKDLQQELDKHYSIARPATSREHISIDHTRKWLLKYNDNEEAETVYIPEEGRGTLCVSSQIGCTLSCKFCHTGTQKLVRNLTANEIVSQLLIARDRLEEWPSTREIRMISNIVMMGMGEPLYNYDNVKTALQILMDNEGIAISRRKITLSTSGVVPMIEQCGRELGVQLAISLHAVRDDLRNELVPLNKKYPIKDLLDACRRYPSASNSKRITFEYVMLKGINDSLSDAKELVKLIKGIPAKINLIPFNPWPGTIYECSSDDKIDAFARFINDAGYASPVRRPRGRDVYAACGQLKSDSERKSKSILNNTKSHN